MRIPRIFKSSKPPTDTGEDRGSRLNTDNELALPRLSFDSDVPQSRERNDNGTSAFYLTRSRDSLPESLSYQSIERRDENPGRDGSIQTEGTKEDINLVSEFIHPLLPIKNASFRVPLINQDLPLGRLVRPRRPFQPVKLDPF